MTFAAHETRALGGYRILRRLGSGGMAEVFLATQRMAGGVERTVVVKTILPAHAADEDFVQMFLREARIAAALSHPNIVHIHDVAIIEGRPCIVMEFLRGRDLAFVMRRAKKAGHGAPAPVAAAIAAQAAVGLDHAHQKKDELGRPMAVVHRDVSPHNLFVVRDGHVRVFDFGIARSAHEQQLTDADTIKGKLAYLAPEYLGRRQVTAKLDQFAVGIVLWEMLTGRQLFHRSDPLTTMQAILEHTPTPPSVLAAGIAPELDRITLRALARDPDQRFPDCGAFASALRAWLRGAEVRPEAELVAGWLEELVPIEEDAALYAPSGVSPIEADITDVDRTDPRTSSGVQGRSSPSDAPDAIARTATVSLPSVDEVPQREPGSAAPTTPAEPHASGAFEPSARLAVIAGVLTGVLVAAIALVVTTLASWNEDVPVTLATPPSSAPPPTVASPPPVTPPTTAPAVESAAPVAVEDAAPAAAPATIAVRFTHVSGVQVTVDGERVRDNVWRGPPSSAPRRIRFRRSDGESAVRSIVLEAPTTISCPDSLASLGPGLVGPH